MTGQESHGKCSALTSPPTAPFRFANGSFQKLALSATKDAWLRNLLPLIRSVVPADLGAALVRLALAVVFDRLLVVVSWTRTLSVDDDDTMLVVVVVTVVSADDSRVVSLDVAVVVRGSSSRVVARLVADTGIPEEVVTPFGLKSGQTKRSGRRSRQEGITTTIAAARKNRGTHLRGSKRSVLRHPRRRVARSQPRSQPQSCGGHLAKSQRKLSIIGKHFGKTGKKKAHATTIEMEQVQPIQNHFLDVPNLLARHSLLRSTVLLF